MANWPMNDELTQGIAKSTFYGALTTAQEGLVFPKLCQEIQQEDLTTTYTSFGGVPEPRQLSGSVASTGERLSRGMRDYKMSGTVVEWEQTVEVPRSVIETNPQEIPRITTQMAQKAMLYMDRRFVATILPAATLGYDGLALYANAHTETGAAQDNNLTAAAAGTIPTATFPTPAELEASLSLEIGTLKGFTDDRLTPVNAGVRSFTILVPITYEFHYRAILETPHSQSPGLDVSGGTGRFRGMFTVLASPFVGSEDRHYLFADRVDTKAVALLKNKDFEFVTNIGTDSDTWRHKQMAVFSSYARWEFIPWDWKTTLIEVWT